MSAIVDTLCDTDLSTLFEALQQGDLGLIRMDNGEPPTPEQLELLMQVGPAELDASVKEMERRAMLAENAAYPPDRIAKLMQKYDAQEGEPLDQVRLRMSAEDNQEVTEMIRLMMLDQERIPL